MIDVLSIDLYLCVCICFRTFFFHSILTLFSDYRCEWMSNEMCWYIEWCIPKGLALMVIAQVLLAILIVRQVQFLPTFSVLHFIDLRKRITIKFEWRRMEQRLVISILVSSTIQLHGLAKWMSFFFFPRSKRRKNAAVI